MPPRVLVKPLLDLSLMAVCNNMKDMIIIANRLTEAADDILIEAEDNINDIVQTSQGRSVFEIDSDTASVKMSGLKEALRQQGDFCEIISEYLEDVPAFFVDKVFNRLVVDLANVSLDDHEIMEFMHDRWSCLHRIKFRFHLMAKSMLGPKVTTLNLTPIMDTIGEVFVQYVIQDNFEVMRRMEKRKMDLFLPAMEKNRVNMASLTTLNLLHLAHGPLIWLISGSCPNLWHLDIRGVVFDLQRHSHRLDIGPDCTAFDSEGKKRYNNAEFITSLCALYGNDGKCHKEYGKVKGCPRLKRLYLPWMKWEKEEEIQLLCETFKILHQLRDLEDFKGANIMHILVRINQTTYPPIMLKLKNFSNRYGGYLTKADPSQLRNVRLPLVTEVELIISACMPLSIMEVFPNARHVSLSPYKCETFTFQDTLKYLTNLETLNLHVPHEVSVEDVCNIAKKNPHLKVLTLTSAGVKFSPQPVDKKKIEMIFETRDTDVFDVDTERMEEMFFMKREPNKLQFKYSDFVDSLSSLVSATHIEDEDKDEFIPNFHNLQELTLTGMHSVDKAALLIFVKGCPNLRTLTIAFCYCRDPIAIDDDMVGKIVSKLSLLREFYLMTDGSSNYMKFEVTSRSVQHILRFCKYIEAIGCLGSWGLSNDEAYAWKHVFKAKNYAVKVY